MNSRKYALQIIRDFAIIFSNTMIFTTIFLYVFSIKQVDRSLLWQILLISGVAALSDIIYYYKRWIDSVSLLMKMIIHFILIYSLYMTSGYLFHWFRSSDTSFIIWFSLFLVIGYTVVFLFIRFSEKKQAVQINKKLNEYKNKRGGPVE